MMRITILLLAVALSSTFATQGTPNNDCGEDECIHKDVNSHDVTEYIEIPEAAAVHRFEPEATGGTCRNKTNLYYRIDPIKPVVVVQKHCSGSFKICFIPGICEDYNLSPRRPNVTLHNACRIHTMECKRRHTDATCTKGYDFDIMHDNYAEVRNGCDCDFTLCHDVKDIIPAEDTTTIPAEDTTTTAAPANTPMAAQPNDLQEYNRETESQNTNGQSDTVSGSSNNDSERERV